MIADKLPDDNFGYEQAKVDYLTRSSIIRTQTKVRLKIYIFQYIKKFTPTFYFTC